jgi:hypothetical protein
MQADREAVSRCSGWLTENRTKATSVHRLADTRRCMALAAAVFRLSMFWPPVTHVTSHRHAQPLFQVSEARWSNFVFGFVLSDFSSAPSNSLTEISGFCRDVEDICVLLGYYTTPHNIPEERSSNLTEVFRSFPQPLQVNFGIAP